MKNLFLFLLVCGLTKPLFGQVIELDTVVIRPITYKYIYEVVDDDIDQSVKDLQIKLGKFDITKEEYYNDEYAYDKDGKLLRTIERYKNVKLPLAVSEALVERFPKWTVDKDIYKVSYSEPNWESKKTYKLKLSNGEKTIRVKTDENGNFL
jgi:hypothetical protein